MADILQEIVAHKREEVAADKAARPLDSVKAAANDADPPRGFYGAVTRRTPIGINLIAEIKRRSPSAGLIREDFTPAAIARIYHAAGASAISVLTDQRYFDGRLDFIREVRAAVPLPVLRKDFVIDAYQIWQARAAEADAVLLIAEVLPVETILEYTALAAELGMAVLVEAHSANLMQDLLAAFGRTLPSNLLVGINNRDLTVQKIDLATTARLARLMQDTSVLVSESGIRSREDVQEVQRAGARAILVGESILRTEDMAATIHHLLGTAP